MLDFVGDLGDLGRTLGRLGLGDVAGFVLESLGACLGSRFGRC